MSDDYVKGYVLFVHWEWGGTAGWWIAPHCSWSEAQSFHSAPVAIFESDREARKFAREVFGQELALR